MKRFKTVVSIILITAMLLCMSGCAGSYRRSSRRDRDRDDAEESSEETARDDTGEIECETEFGTYTIGYGWVEVESHSTPPDYYSYCAEGNENSQTPPNNLAVSHDTNYYGPDEDDDFATAILQQIHGQAAAYNGTASMTEYGTFGENQVYRFDLEMEDFNIYQWYVCGDHEYVMFSLAIYDFDEAEEDHSMDVAEEAVNSFVWNR